MSAPPTRPTVVDLFAGVGGMSLGAARAGFDVRAAVELDQIAAATHGINFPTSKHLVWDVASTSGRDLLEASGIPVNGLDGLVGGPPCQGFSEAGKRSVDDPRNKLFGHFFRLVAETRPRFFVAENVPGISDARNEALVAEALDGIPKEYVLLPITEVAAHRFGAPTKRARVFFVGYDPNRMLPVSGDAVFKASDQAEVTVGEALFGLPTIRSDWQREEQGWRKTERPSVQLEFYRKLSDAVPLGVGSQMALDRLRRDSIVSGCLGTRHTEDVTRRFNRIRPGETDPISHAPRLQENGFCPTLRAGTGADRGSFQAVRPIHYKSPRVITPREAARLQGFPDWFQFHGTKWHAFRQIGNSVSPMVAETLLGRIRARLL